MKYDATSQRENYLYDFSASFRKFAQVVECNELYLLVLCGLCVVASLKIILTKFTHTHLYESMSAFNLSPINWMDEVELKCVVRHSTTASLFLVYDSGFLVLVF